MTCKYCYDVHISVNESPFDTVKVPFTNLFFPAFYEGFLMSGSRIPVPLSRTGDRDLSSYRGDLEAERERSGFMRLKHDPEPRRIRNVTGAPSINPVSLGSTVSALLIPDRLILFGSSWQRRCNTRLRGLTGSFRDEIPARARWPLKRGIPAKVAVHMSFRERRALLNGRT